MTTDTDLVQMKIPENIINLVDVETVNDYHVIPIQLMGSPDHPTGIILTGFNEAEVLKSLALIETKIGLPVYFKTVDRQVIEAAAAHYYGITLTGGSGLEFKTFSEVMEQDDTDDDQSFKDSNSPVVFKVNEIIKEAIRARASDIHIEPMDIGSEVWFRIDGDLIDYSDRFPISQKEKMSVVRIIKNRCADSGLDISKTQIEQKGQFFIQYDKKLIEFRVGIAPTIRGEMVTIRILDSSKIVLSLEELGYEPEDLFRYRRRLNLTSGLIVFAAPTGHGKTTSLYASLMERRAIKKEKICAVEDPPEYRVQGISQIPVRNNEKNEDLNFTYLKAIKATLRQDPNVLLIGETRSQEEAAAVLEASQTGHMMFTTVHARNSLLAIARLLNMGNINKRDLLAEIVCIVAQRLVKLNCPVCSEPYLPSDRAFLNLTAEESERIMKGSPKKSRGCPECAKAGRRAIAEFLFLDNQTRDFLTTNPGINDTLAFMKEKKGFKDMWEKGLEMVATGEITLESLMDVLDRNEDDEEELRNYRSANPS